MELPSINKETQDFLLECNEEYSQPVTWFEWIKISAVCFAGVFFVLINKNAANELGEALQGAVVYNKLVQSAKFRKQVLRNQ